MNEWVIFRRSTMLELSNVKEGYSKKNTRQSDGI